MQNKSNLCEPFWLPILLLQQALKIGYQFSGNYPSKETLWSNLPVLWLREKKFTFFRYYAPKSA